MNEKTWGRVSGEGGGERAYIRDVNWVTYLGGVYSGGVLTGFCGISNMVLFAN